MKDKPPSVRAKKYIQNKVAGMSDYQAAIAAGYSPNTAVAASTNIENPSVKKYMAEILEDHGLTDDYLAGNIKKAIDEASRIHGTGDNFVEIPDYAVKQKYIDMTLKLKGHYNDVGGEAPTLTFNFYGTKLTTNRSNSTSTKTEEGA